MAELATIRVVLGEGDAIRRVVITNPDGTNVAISAKDFLIAAGIDTDCVHELDLGFYSVQGEIVWDKREET